MPTLKCHGTGVRFPAPPLSPCCATRRNRGFFFGAEGPTMMPAHIATPVPATPPRNLLWTVDQFHYLGDLGVFEGRRAMLIAGVIVEEGPMNPPHRIALELSGD